MRDSEAALRVIFDSAYDAIFLHDMDGCVLDVNSRMLALYGLEKEEARKNLRPPDFDNVNSNA
ncbi:MAG: PAS domain S-box protein [Desulfuromonadales bacterium]